MIENTWFYAIVFFKMDCYLHKFLIFVLLDQLRVLLMYKFSFKKLEKPQIEIKAQMKRIFFETLLIFCINVCFAFGRS